MELIKNGVLLLSVAVTLLLWHTTGRAQPKSKLRPQILTNRSLTYSSHFYLLWFSHDARALFVLDGIGRLYNWDLARNKVSEPINVGSQTYASAITSDCSLLACAADSTAVLRDVRRNRELWRKETIPGAATAVAFSDDKASIAVADNRGTVYLLDRKTGAKMPLTLQGDKGDVNYLAFSKNGKLLCAVVERKKIQCFELATGKLIASKTADDSRIIHTIFSPNEKHLVVACRIVGPPRRNVGIGGLPPDPFVTWRKVIGGELQIWDFSLSKAPRRIAIDRDTITHFAISPDEKYIAGCRDDGAVMLWRAKDLKTVAHFDGHEGVPDCIAFAPDGKKLVVGYRDKKFLLWDIRSITSVPASSGKLSPTFHPPYPIPKEGTKKGQ